jgi:2-methylcitrate dehydratase PrpD
LDVKTIGKDAGMDKTNAQMTRILAEHVDSFRRMQFQTEIVRQVKRALLDFYCAVVTGSQTETAKLLFQYLISVNGNGTYRTIGFPSGLSRTDAAFMNGTSAHCLDFDDGHTHGSMHPGAVVIPAVLAVSQKTRPSPQDFIKSIVIGYDVCLRIAASMHPASRHRGFHNTPAAGIFGAATAAAYLYGATIPQILDALGVAGSFAGGTFAFLGTGSEVKRIHPGQASRDGLMAAELAMAGLAGPHTILEDKNGFFHAFAGEFSAGRLMQELGVRFEIMDMYFKPYPCCRHLHSSIDCIYEMKKAFPIEPEHVKRIRIGVNQLTSLHDNKKCEKLLDAQLSLPFSAAAAVFYPHVNVRSFELSAVPKRVWQLCNLVDIYVDSEIDKSYPQQRGAKVQIETMDGNVYEHFVDNPLGEPSKPMPDEQLLNKFMDNCSPVIGMEQAKLLAHGIEHLETSIDFLLDN